MVYSAVTNVGQRKKRLVPAAIGTHNYELRFRLFTMLG